ncbi:MAG: methyl-accepting chemotaxis protein [Bacillota bacterium]|nr:methyl-accepting chemotaxis protein [Bacillota bacterium]
MKKLKIRGKIITLIVSVILFLVATLLVIVDYQVNKAIMLNLQQQLNAEENLVNSLINEKYKGSWKAQGDNLFKGDQLINDNNNLVDMIKKDTSTEVTFFLKDTRVATTIKNNGNRAVGTKAAQAVVQAVLQKGEVYTGEAMVVNVPHQVIYSPIKDENGNNIGMIFLGIPKSQLNAEINTLMISIVSIALLAIILAMIIALRVTGSISDSLRSAVEHLSLVSKGDLSIGVSQRLIRRTDEVGDLVKAAEYMQNSIKGMFLGIKDISDNINKHAESLTQVSGEMACSAESVATAITDVSKGTEEQANDLIGITEILSRFSSDIDIMVHQIEEIDAASREINIMANGSNGKMQKLINSVADMSNSFKEFVNKINGFGDNINKVNEITALINSIADQTNLLALNAAIEAARAGESGKGFAVVAEEIRKLAEQSKKSSENINKLISIIANDTKIIVSNTESMSFEMNNESNDIESSITSFKRIVQSVDIITPKIEVLNNFAEKINKDKNGILQKIEGASSVAEEVSASAQLITASTEEMSSSSEEVAASADALKNTTIKMMDDINKFKL